MPLEQQEMTMTPVEACQEQSDIVDYQLHEMVLHPQIYGHLPERWQTVFNAIEPYIKPNSKILDVGCRTGEFLEQVFRICDSGLISCKIPLDQLYGIDVSKPAIEIAVKDRKLNRCVSGDLHKTEYKDDYFDIITASHVLEHSYDMRLFRDEMFRILKPNGVLAVLIPIEGKPWPGHEKPVAVGHYNFFPDPGDIVGPMGGRFNVQMHRMNLGPPQKDGMVWAREVIFLLKPKVDGS